MIRDGFDEFCAGILNRPLWPGELAPAQLAREFVRHFDLSNFPTIGHLEQLARNASVGEVVATTLPEGLRDTHGGIRGGKYVISYLEDDWDGGREHTLLHET